MSIPEELKAEELFDKRRKKYQLLKLRWELTQDKRKLKRLLALYKAHPGISLYANEELRARLTTR